MERLMLTAGPAGMTPEQLHALLPAISRSTLNRRLALLAQQGRVYLRGAGRVTRYVSSSPLSRADTDLQAFANSNKRTARLAANAPLLAQGLLPFSFADINKADYIRGMAAFYELGHTQLIAQTFVEGYAKSVVRSSVIFPSLRTQGFDVSTVARELCDFIRTGKWPTDPRVAMFLKPL